MAKEKKRTDSEEQMDLHVDSILKVLNSIDNSLSSLVYHQRPSRGFDPSVEKAMAQAFMDEGKTPKDKIKELVIEELRKLNEENK